MRARQPLRITLTLLAAAGLAACSSDSQDPPPETVDSAGTESEPAMQVEPATASAAIPDRIVIARGGFMPEGIEYDRTNGRFLVGSFSAGTVFEIGADGSVTPFIDDPDLVSSAGIEADEARGRLLVTNSNGAAFGMPVGDPEGPRRAQLGVYDLNTGERLAMVDLGAVIDAGEEAVFFANDVAVADDGTAFVTDTIRNVVYRVDADYNAGVHYRFDPTEGLALNGIEWHPDGYLIVADLGNGQLYRLPDAPGSVAALVALPEAMAGADGIVWRADGALAVVQNSPVDGRVVALGSDDGWQSAQIIGVATHAGQATTAASVGDAIYTVQPHFADQEAPTIERAVF